jgi:hypothetical protein
MRAMDRAADDEDFVAYLEARADWFKAERVHGGSIILGERESECRHLAAKFQSWGIKA